MHLYAGGVVTAGLPELIRQSPHFAGVSFNPFLLPAFPTHSGDAHSHSFINLCDSALFSLENEGVKHGESKLEKRKEGRKESDREWYSKNDGKHVRK